MGNKNAPPIPIAFMRSLESNFVQNCLLKPSLLLRYIDNYFGIWVHGLKSLLQFYENINNYIPSSDQVHPGAHLLFGNLVVFRHHGNSPSPPHGGYTTKLFIKPMAAPPHYASHPMKTKSGILTSQTKRAIRISSSPNTTKRNLDKIKRLFL